MEQIFNLVEQSAPSRHRENMISMPACALRGCELAKGNLWQFLLVQCRVVIEVHCASSADNYEAGLNTSCSTHNCKNFFVTSGKNIKKLLLAQNCVLSEAAADAIHSVFP